MGKIGLMYLNVSNLGDLVIYETARYILQDILEKNHLEDYEIVPVDIGSYQYKVDEKFDFHDGFFRKALRKERRSAKRPRGFSRVCRSGRIPGFC